MEFWGYVALVGGAIVIGLVAKYLIRQRFGYEWLVTAIGAGIGGFVASEYLGSLSDWGTEWEGLRIFPALIGGIVVGAIVEFVMHFLTNLPTSEHGMRRPTPTA